MAKSLAEKTTRLAGDLIQKRPIYVHGQVRWFDVWALVSSLIFFGYITIVGCVHLDPHDRLLYGHLGCDVPLASYLAAAGGANVALSSYRFLCLKRGALLQMVAGVALAAFGLYVYAGHDSSLTVAGYRGYCCPTVLQLSVVVFVTLGAQSLLLGVLLVIVWLVEEKSRFTEQESFTKNVEEWDPAKSVESAQHYAVIRNNKQQ